MISGLIAVIFSYIPDKGVSSKQGWARSPTEGDEKEGELRYCQRSGRAGERCATLEPLSPSVSLTWSAWNEQISVRPLGQRVTVSILSGI
jgi:hypothetical protein